MNLEEELSSLNSSSVSLFSASGYNRSASTVEGGAATRAGVRERLLLLLGRVCFVKNRVFWFEKNGKGLTLWGLVIGEESVSVVAKAEME